MNSGDVDLFTYGSFRDTRVQLALFGRELTGRGDALLGYVASPLAITDENVLAKGGPREVPIADASGSNDDEILGLVVRLTPEELTIADAYEVSDYKRVQVTFKSGTTGWAYVRA